jgi:glycosyltransferase involved in cell wall biosynthesis
MNQTLSVIIPYWSDIDDLKKVINTAKELSPLEIVVVVNKESKEAGELQKGLKCKVTLMDMNDQEKMYHLIGVKTALGEVLLFLDGDVVIPLQELKEFVQPLFNGEADMVVNNLDYFLEKGTYLSPNMVWCQNLNELSGRRDWNIDTLLSFPYAFTKELVDNPELKGIENPLLMQMKVFGGSWRIKRGDVSKWIPIDKLRPFHELNQHIFNDFLDALKVWLSIKGHRGGMKTGGKRLDILDQLKKNKTFPYIKKGWGGTSSRYNGKQLSIIIPAQNEELTIEAVILEARKLDPIEIIVVVNGSADKTAEIASNLGATIIEYRERLGHNMGRSIGALESRGDIILFIDSDFAIPADDLLPFVEAVANGVDMALNDLNSYLPIQYPLHNVSAFKYGLNLISRKSNLGIGSLLAVPNAISRTCLNHVGFETLVCPSLAQVKAIVNHFKVACVHPVDVMKPNRMRPEQHLGSYIDGGSREEIINKLMKDERFDDYQRELNKIMPQTRGWGITSSLYNGKQLSVIISAQNNGQTVEKVIREARKIEPYEVIVIVNGSQDDTEEIAKKLGTTVIKTEQQLDYDTAHAIGALASRSDIIYFVDAAQKGQTPAEQRIIGDHLEAISFLINTDEQWH